MEKTESVCMYDVGHLCQVLERLSIEFEGEEHLSLIYGTLLPAYCVACPHLKLLQVA